MRQFVFPQVRCVYLGVSLTTSPYLFTSPVTVLKRALPVFDFNVASSGGVDACPQTYATSGKNEEGHAGHAQRLQEGNFTVQVVLVREGNARAEVEEAERCGSCWQPPIAALHDMGRFYESPQTAETTCLDRLSVETSDAGHYFMV